REAEEDLPLGAEELEDGQQLAIGAGVLLDRVVDAGTEHLHQVAAGHPARRDVEAVRLGTELRIERQGDPALADQEGKRVGRVGRPGAVVADLDQPLEPDLADAGRHAPRLARGVVGAEGLVPALDSRVAADALLAGPGGPAVHRLLVGAALDALAVAAAPL